VFASLKNFSQRRNLTLVASLSILGLLASGCASYTPKAIPQMSVSTSTLNFQTVVVGQKATQTIKVSNTGNGTLQISGISATNKEFTVTGTTFPVSILPAATQSYTLTFAPTAAGSASATLNISSNATPAVAAVSLSGVGEKAFADLVISPTVLSFGSIALKSTKTQNVTLQNTGDISMSVQGITISGAGFGFSDLSPGFTLAPNQKVTFQVWFTPKAAGAAAATLTLLSANLTSPETLGMSGTGVSSTTTPPPTTPPTNPQPTAHTVALTWGASSSTVVGYRVYRSDTSGGSYTVLNGTALNALSYTDSSVTDGTTYYYVVTAVDSSGNESVYSNQVSAAVPAS
jgi:hypothetical protein